MYTLTKIERFHQNVLSKYHVYNSVFLTLPFDAIDNTGVLLPLFSEVCEKGFQRQETPIEIVNFFNQKYLDNADEHHKIGLLFRFIQYIERQIVLFDAIEDAAFPIVNNLEGKGSLRDSKETADGQGKAEAFRDFLNEFKVRTVLTAHPTQFYPGSVLGIITDLTAAIRQDDLVKIKELLSQLGKTPFIKKQKPTPFDEAVSLTWYLENVFYQTCGAMLSYIQKNVFAGAELKNPIFNLGFWPGGDRDGNPFVTTEITLQVAERLRSSILKNYYKDIRNLKRKLTFNKVDVLIADLEQKIYRSVFYSEGAIFITVAAFEKQLHQIREIIIEEHQSLYLDEINDLINKVKLFGFHFASLDLRQNSKIHDAVFADLFKVDENFQSKSITEKMKLFQQNYPKLIADNFGSLTRATIESLYAMKTIQNKNGEPACNRYIISNCESAWHVMQVLALAQSCDWEHPTLDIVPLFEVIDDLQNAPEIMEQLYNNPIYKKHLQSRGNQQTVMLGFSDGTKDGGYLMANWSIYKAKENITSVSRKYGIKVIFFDGRGGPPARGGGKTHQFYASLGRSIENCEIQVTVQGQTISSNFGTPDSCRYNLENLLSAGVSNQLFDQTQATLTESQKSILDELAQIGYQRYSNFKKHPKFIPYLEQISTLNYYAKTNIGSRPSKRSNSDTLDFSELRAIPFVGSWSQLKQNVPGFFGVGSALKHFEQSGRWTQVQHLYRDSLFFRTLLENSMMSLAKSFFPLTAYLKDDPGFGAFWQIIYNEYLETKRLLLKIAGHSELMENYPDGKASIAMRENIVKPLLAIQQYALLRISQLQKQENADTQLIETYQKLVTRSLFGNINASRNSA
ncbi:phosphoenolpyruvate carboxylase [Flavobacterium sp. CYK-4]|uniref:phosphoenolpyruvate carboxylase n=1 Tax=Flavobacterium lotistagni TaxID=2709660 RepID=UPI00140B14F7|nr:phosphoenolpyruvate carboxylase [Flavobacterium lotistagni]NHM07469.1 phosphoenolpyruvate carboxylase [Flavobacterium lotistagni]